LNFLNRANREQLAALSGIPLAEVEALFTTTAPHTRKLDIELGDISLRNINTDDDANRAIHILKTLNLSPEALAALIAGTNPVQLPQAAPTPTVQQQTAVEGGTTIQEMIPRFATRKKDKLSSKTLYEYGNDHWKFVEWLELRKKKRIFLFTALHVQT
jgi:hypothetical protein